MESCKYSKWNLIYSCNCGSIDNNSSFVIQWRVTLGFDPYLAFLASPHFSFDPSKSLFCYAEKRVSGFLALKSLSNLLH